jgi:transcriptional regulator GlxA family with amidase domain
MTWALSNLHRRLTVDDMAARAVMSPRTFARRFRVATGTTPHAWLTTRRLARAEELLKVTDLSIEQIARRVGYASGGVLREIFVRSRGVAPRDFRRRFGCHRRAVASLPRPAAEDHGANRRVAPAVNRRCGGRDE